LAERRAERLGRLRRPGRAAFIDGSHRYPVAVENLNDEAINRKVDEAYRAKYAAEGSSLLDVVSPEVARVHHADHTSVT
jgi:hypothetical protein